MHSPSAEETRVAWPPPLVTGLHWTAGSVLVNAKTADFTGISLNREKHACVECQMFFEFFSCLWRDLWSISFSCCKYSTHSSCAHSMFCRVAGVNIWTGTVPSISRVLCWGDGVGGYEPDSNGLGCGETCVPHVWREFATSGVCVCGGGGPVYFLAPMGEVPWFREGICRSDSHHMCTLSTKLWSERQNIYTFLARIKRLFFSYSLDFCGTRVSL